MFFDYDLSCAFSGDGPDILLATDSERPVMCIYLVFWSIICAPLQISESGVRVVTPEVYSLSHILHRVNTRCVKLWLSVI